MSTVMALQKSKSGNNNIYSVINIMENRNASSSNIRSSDLEKAFLFLLKIIRNLP